MSLAKPNSWIAASQRFIGKKWVESGFECYDFVRAMYADVTGMELPIIPNMHTKHHSAQFDLMMSEFPEVWEPLTTPEPGALVTMSKGAIPHHCGIYVGQQFVAHVYCARHGVMLSRKEQLRAQQWNICSYLRYVQPPA